MSAVLMSEWVLLVLFALAALDGVFPPIPSETAIIALTSSAVSTGHSDVAVIALVAAGGAMVGDQLTYHVGTRLGHRTRRNARMRRSLTRAGTMLARHGGPVIFAARFVPGGRAAVTVSAGAVDYPRRAFTLWTCSGAVAWAVYYALIGSLAGTWVTGNSVVAVVVGVSGGIVVGLLIDQLARRVRARLAARTRVRVPAATKAACHADPPCS